MVETKPHNARYDRPATLSLVPDVPGLRVLDAGRGPGVYAAEPVRRGATVVGIDVTPRMIELAAERLDGLPAELLVADLEKPPPFADGAFDLVLSALALDCVADRRPWDDGNYFERERISFARTGFGGPPHVREPGFLGLRARAVGWEGRGAAPDPGKSL